jgi:hypothetical protein
MVEAVAIRQESTVSASQRSFSVKVIVTSARHFPADPPKRSKESWAVSFKNSLDDLLAFEYWTDFSVVSGPHELTFDVVPRTNTRSWVARDGTTQTASKGEYACKLISAKPL